MILILNDLYWVPNHPNKGGDPVKFNEIQNAYDCLEKKQCS